MVVPWLIAMLGLLTDCKAAAEDYPVGLNDIARRVKAAAGILSHGYPCHSRSNALTDHLSLQNEL